MFLHSLFIQRGNSEVLSLELELFEIQENIQVTKLSKEAGNKLRHSKSNTMNIYNSSNKYFFCVWNLSLRLRCRENKQWQCSVLWMIIINELFGSSEELRKILHADANFIENPEVKVNSVSYHSI